jgi:hypothetical protein
VFAQVWFQSSKASLEPYLGKLPGVDAAGMRLATHSFILEDVTRLSNILQNKYGLKCAVREPKEGPIIYIFKESMMFMC